MKYYSTNKKVSGVSLEDAVVKGLADDKGLFMPDKIKQLPQEFFDTIENLSFQEIAYTVADAFFGEDVEADALKKIVYETLNFDVPLVHVNDNIYSLELFHGPTLAFKDVGGRFMSRLLGYFIQKQNKNTTVNVLVATSGDTGSAVANGFLGVEGIHVYVLYPKGLVSPIQECQFTTLGQNITALEVDGTFDDCQALVKSAFMDDELNAKLKLTSANSINVARFLPQSFYYFYAYAQLKALNPKLSKEELEMVFCVPSGNFGNITAGLFAKKMGLPVKRFIAANNRNDIFLQYLQTGEYKPRPSVATIANAMDVGDPSNFARVLDLYNGSHTAITEEISGVSYTDEQIAETLKRCKQETNYLLDPHGAVGYRALKEYLKESESGIFLETAHPAKFLETVEGILGETVEIPLKLQEFMKGEKKSLPMKKDFQSFKDFSSSFVKLLFVTNTLYFLVTRQCVQSFKLLIIRVKFISTFYSIFVGR
jgi:threonine synthase